MTLSVVKLTGGVVFEVDESAETLGELAAKAKREDQFFQINSPRGKTLVVNPDHVVYIDSEGSSGPSAGGSA